MRRFWISWYSAIDADTEVPYPCWITGERGWYGEEGFAFTYVADMQAKSEEDAYNKVSELFPDYERRFCSEIDKDWQPSDRFK